MIKPRLKVLFLIILRETQIIVTIITAFAILQLRTAHSIWFGLGMINSTLIAKLLKRFIRQPRPIETNKISSSYGMPSTHSSSISFFGIYLFLTSISLPIHRNLIGFLKPILSSQSILILLDPQSDDSLHHLHLLQFIRIWLGFSFLTFSGIVCWSRVRLGYHTPSQVIVGSLIGTLLAFTWFTLWIGNLRFNQLHPISSSQRNGLVEWGDHLERIAEDSSYLFLEAWQMRDGGLLWDSLIRPSLNSICLILGFNPCFESGDQLGVHDYLKPLNTKSTSIS
ncbi:PAP2 superfamily-domain-containing protein [Melampsora americana]|nr:PAP2 superfamily-domain-containing protein [Melampsora americana]